MHVLHSQFQNLKNVYPGCQGVDYITYLDTFARFERNKQRELSKPYQEYINNLYEYITGFIRRAFPLVDLDEKLKEYNEEYDKMNNDNQNDEGKPSSDNSNGAEKSTEENPLYCKVCQRSFAKETVFKAHLKGKKHLAAVST